MALTSPQLTAQLLVDYLMQELDPDNTGGVTKARMMGASAILRGPRLSSCPIISCRNALGGRQEARGSNPPQSPASGALKFPDGNSTRFLNRRHRSRIATA